MKDQVPGTTLDKVGAEEGIQAQPPSLNGEEWRAVPGREGFYSVSDHGRVWRGVAPRCDYANRMVPASISSALGYPQVHLVSNGVTERVYVHHLVAAAFLGARPGGYEVNHKDGDKANCRPGNLEYVTRSGNMLHAYRLGLIRQPLKLSDEAVAEIRASSEFQRVLAERYGVCPSLVSLIQLGQRRTRRQVSP